MNERIKELYTQSLETRFDYSGGNNVKPGEYYSNYKTVLNAEKFAVLIVKETIIEMCQQLYWHGEDQSNNPSFYKAIDKTKKQFGVEE